jgi:mRNA interferase YafQ
MMPKQLKRHKAFAKDFRNARMSDQQATKFFLYVAALLKDETLPVESRDHSLNGEWGDFREFHIGGDLLVIYTADADTVHLARIGSHAQLFKNM